MHLVASTTTPFIAPRVDVLLATVVESRCVSRVRKNGDCLQDMLVAVVFTEGTLPLAQ